MPCFLQRAKVLRIILALDKDPNKWSDSLRDWWDMVSRRGPPQATWVLIRWSLVNSLAWFSSCR